MLPSSGSSRAEKTGSFASFTVRSVLAEWETPPTLSIKEVTGKDAARPEAVGHRV